MSRSISKQLEHAVYECFTPGHSKRADKFNPAIDTSWKIYSLTSRRDMLDLAKDFGKYLKEKHSEIKKAFDISPAEIQSYLDTKAATCVDKTLDKIISRLGKLETCCKHVYSGSDFSWRVDCSVKPKSTKNVDFVKDTPIPFEVSKAAIEALTFKKSEVYRAVILSAYCGMRSEETTCLKAQNIHFTGGEFGYGWVEIVKGGGAKGDRPRIIPIISIEAQQALRKATAGKQAADYIASKEDGRKMTADNVQRALREWMDKAVGRKYKGNRCHGMRKTWAQSYYDLLRKNGCTKAEAISKTNAALGHGTNRGPSGIKMYVARMW